MGQIALKWGFLTALFSFLWLCLEYALGIQTEYIAFHPVITLLALMIPLFCLYYGLRELKKRDAVPFTFSNALLTGICISGVAAVLSMGVQWIFHSWVNPEFFSTMIAYAESRALTYGGDMLMARQEAEAYFSMESYLLQAVGGSLIGGAVISAILAFFMRNHYERKRKRLFE